VSLAKLKIIRTVAATLGVTASMERRNNARRLWRYGATVPFEGLSRDFGKGAYAVMHGANMGHGPTGGTTIRPYLPKDCLAKLSEERRP
jgi:hypothetical protein